MNNVLALLDLLVRLGQQTQHVIALIKTARAEGRDVTDAELDGLAALDDQKKAELDALISEKKGGKKSKPKGSDHDPVS